MPLQGDQRALLQLICERGQSYEDIAGLLGGSVDDVRAKARGALTELGGADPDVEVGLTDYLLGQADPIGRADAVRFLQSDPESHELATRIEAGLREIAPEAKLPKLPEPRGKARRAATPAAGEPTSAPPRTGAADEAAPRASSRTGGGRQSRLIAAIAGAGVVLLFVILAVAGAFSSDDEGSAAATTATTSEDGSTSTTAAEGQRTVTEVPLKAVGGSGVAGNAGFGIVGGSQLYVDLVVNGLDPEVPRTSTYFIWLMLGDTGGYPLNERLEPDANGRFTGRIAVPGPVAATIAGQADTVKISLSPVDELAREAEQAAEEQVPIVPFTGEELASGKIPLAAPEQG